MRRAAATKTGASVNPARRGVDDVDAAARVVDEELLAGAVFLAHDEIELAAPPPVEITEARVAVAELGDGPDGTPARPVVVRPPVFGVARNQCSASIGAAVRLPSEIGQMRLIERGMAEGYEWPRLRCL